MEDLDGLTLRTLRAGEALDWGALAPPRGDPAEITVALRGTSVMGYLRGSSPDRWTHVVGSAVVRADADFAPVARALLAASEASAPGRALAAMSWDRAEDTAWHEVLLSAGYRVTLSKGYYRRGLADYRSPWPDDLEYVSLIEAGEARFIALLARVREGSVDRALTADDPAHEWASYRDGAGDAFDPAQWQLARRGGRDVGVVLAQIYPDVRHEGSVFALGVVPECRGCGLGRVLHARGLTLLARAGATDYVGSTDVQNTAMDRVFALNGCRRTGVRRFYARGEGGMEQG